MSRSKKVQPAPPWKVYVSSRKPESFQGSANRPGKARSNPRFVQETCLGRTKKTQGRRGPSLRAETSPGVPAPARLCLHRSSGTRQPSRPSGDLDRQPQGKGQTLGRGPVLGHESPTSVGIRPVGFGYSEGGTELDSAFCPVQPSGALTGHQPRRSFGCPCPHIWSRADVSLSSQEEPRRSLDSVGGGSLSPSPTPGFSWLPLSTGSQGPRRDFALRMGRSWAILAWATRRLGNGGKGRAAGQHGEGKGCLEAERCLVPPPIPPTPPRCRVPERPALPAARALPGRVAGPVPVTLHPTPPRPWPRGPRARPQLPVAPPGTSETAGAQADVSP